MSNLVGTFTLFKKEIKRFSKVYMQTIMAPVINNILYFAIFGISLHRNIPEIQGVGYLEFLVPGLIIMGIVNNAYQNPSSSIMIMKYQGLVSDLMTIPLKAGEILFAFISAAVLRSLIIGFATLLTAIFFVDFHFTSIPIIILSALLVSLFFSFIGLIVGLWANEFDRQAFISNFILLPLTFLGGVFYPLSGLPEIFQKLSTFNPIVHMTSLMRYGFTGLEEISVWTSLTVTSTLTFIFGFICYLLLKKGWKLQN